MQSGGLSRGPLNPPKSKRIIAGARKRGQWIATGWELVKRPQNCGVELRGSKAAPQLPAKASVRHQHRLVPGRQDPRRHLTLELVEFPASRIAPGLVAKAPQLAAHVVAAELFV